MAGAASGCAPAVSPANAPTAQHDELLHSVMRNGWYLLTKDQQALEFVTSVGHGPRVVVVHGGFGANLFYMLGAVERHVDDHEFVLFDQRGSLLSHVVEKPENLTIDKLVDDLEQLRVALGEDKLALLAHSMGTVLAYGYAKKYPDHVASLTLMGTFGPTSTVTDSDALWKPISARSSALSHRPEVKAVLQREGFPVPADNDDSDPAVVDQKSTDHWRILFASVNMVRIENWRRMEGGWAFYNGKNGSQLGSTIATTWDLPAVLGARKIPISVVQGDNDYVDPAASGWTTFKRSNAPLSPCVTVDVVPRAGHNSWLDDPDAVERALRRALASKGC